MDALRGARPGRRERLVHGVQRRPGLAQVVAKRWLDQANARVAHEAWRVALWQGRVARATHALSDDSLDPPYPDLGLPPPPLAELARGLLERVVAALEDERSKHLVGQEAYQALSEAMRVVERVGSLPPVPAPSPSEPGPTRCTSCGAAGGMHYTHCSKAEQP